MASHGGVNLDGFWLLPPDNRLALGNGFQMASAAQAQSSDSAERKPNWLLTSVILAGAPLGAALNSFFNHGEWHGPNAGE